MLKEGKKGKIVAFEDGALGKTPRKNSYLQEACFLQYPSNIIFSLGCAVKGACSRKIVSITYSTTERSYKVGRCPDGICIKD
jgi:hypothetical protein